MSGSNYDYKIYPSLLDKFQSFLDAGDDVEAFWNVGEDGMPKLTEEELAAQRERELLDAVNRVKAPTSEAAARGTCFNVIVDSIIDRFDMPETEGMELMFDERAGLWHASLEGHSFIFAHSLCAEVAERIGDSAVPQFPCFAPLATESGNVLLYGYADEVLPERVVDIKTTSSYTFGNYERKWQRLLYPYCLVQSGDMPSVKSLEYLVVQMYRPTQTRPFIDGKVYSEEYTYDHEYGADRLRGICTQLIGWLESHRDVITDTKIFGGDETDQQR